MRRGVLAARSSAAGRFFGREKSARSHAGRNQTSLGIYRRREDDRRSRRAESRRSARTISRATGAVIKRYCRAIRKCLPCASRAIRPRHPLVGSHQRQKRVEVQCVGPSTSKSPGAMAGGFGRPNSRDAERPPEVSERVRSACVSLESTSACRDHCARADRRRSGVRAGTGRRNEEWDFTAAAPITYDRVRSRCPSPRGAKLRQIVGYK